MLEEEQNDCGGETEKDPAAGDNSCVCTPSTDYFDKASLSFFVAVALRDIRPQEAAAPLCNTVIGLFLFPLPSHECNF